jgi:hypothetical protein
MNIIPDMKLNLSNDEREALLADLAWDYSEKRRIGQRLNLNEYLKKCPDEESRRELRSVIAMSALADCVCATIRKCQ